MAPGCPAGARSDPPVPSRLAVVVIDAVRPRLLAGFWCEVLGWQVLGQDDDGVITIGPADRAWPMIDIAPVPETKMIKNRLHLDLRADGVPAPAELDRLLSLGARPADVGQPADASWVVLADPEGNEFCLLSRTVQEVRGPAG